MKLECASKADLELIASIAFKSKSHWDYPVDLLEKCRLFFLEEFSENYLKNSHLFLIKQNDVIIGFGSLVNKEEPMLDHLWLLPDFIGKGLGKKAFLLFVKEAKDLGYKTLLIISDINSEKFYAKMGAEKIGTLHSPLQNLDLPKMRLSLKP